jgi:hypothetical protein
MLTAKEGVTLFEIETFFTAIQGGPLNRSVFLRGGANSDADSAAAA